VNVRRLRAIRTPTAVAANEVLSELSPVYPVETPVGGGAGWDDEEEEEKEVYTPVPAMNTTTTPATGASTAAESSTATKKKKKGMFRGVSKMFKGVFSSGKKR
jgi:hypothetical protein